MRVPEPRRHRAAPRPRPGNRTGLARLAGGMRRRAVPAGVLTVVAAVAAVAFVRLATADAALSAIPAADLAHLKEGAASCPALTPAKLAGQIMGPQRAGKDKVVLSVGPAAWKAYAPSADADPADHRAKVLALARQTCDLVGQLRVAKVGGDPWRTAVAATHVGLAEVVKAKGIPAAAKSFVATVVAAADWYASQKQFGGLGTQVTVAPKTPATTTTTAAKPKPTTPAPKTTTPAPTTAAPTTTPAPTPTATTAATAAAAPLASTPPSGAVTAYDPQVKYQIFNAHAKRVLELPGDDTDTRTGTPVQIWSDLDAADQFWFVRSVPGTSYHQIVNASSGKVLAVRDHSLEDFAGVDQVVADAGDKAQQWELRDAGQGEVWIVNQHSGKALDLFGDDLTAADGQLVNLWSLQTYAVDQRWTIVR